MCTNPRQRTLKYRDGSSRTITFPCGRCEECRSKKQSEFAALSLFEAMSAGSLAFFTLTYDDGNLPLMANKVDKGEIVHQHIVDYRCPDFSHDYELFPSLCREHVRTWFKNFREDYKRRHGERVKFSYACFGEYGDKTKRPHYHCLVYGLDTQELHRLKNSWQFGFTDLHVVSQFNSDGSNAFVKLSRYVSKYVAKCDALPDFVRAGLAEKPRLICSQHFGSKSVSSDLQHYRNFILRSTLENPSVRLRFLTEKSVFL